MLGILSMFLIMGITIFKVIKAISEKVKEEKERKKRKSYETLRSNAFEELGIRNSNVLFHFDSDVIVKSRQSLESYNCLKFFKDNKNKLEEAENIITKKKDISKKIKKFLEGNLYMYDSNYHILRAELNDILKNAESFVIMVTYISSRGNNLGSRYLYVKNEDINSCKEKISLEENKINYSKLLKEEMKAELAKKQKEYYNFVNEIIDYANKSKNSLIIKGDTDALDNLIGRLFDRTVNSIKKIKVIDSEEWTLIKDFISNIKNDVEKIVTKNQKMFQYYESDDFLKIKKTCEALMDSQKEFNEYINEKVQTISQLFGTRVVRNETIIDDEYNYIRPYKKTITPFTAEVSAAVFASAENNPLDYVVKYFYPNKSIYKEQIEKLYHLIEELETLREAKQIIENYKEEYKQYLTDVPEYIMKNDESGFYSRLGFAIIDENTLTIEYKFSYTSNGGFVQRSFTIPMTEEIIIELIKTLENKLTIKEFVKEQRLLMTKKLREFIKGRDNFTCCNCGNSIHKEPNLLLEIDHIIPVSKGGTTTEDNLQTLCWKCNRAKSNKII